MSSSRSSRELVSAQWLASSIWRFAQIAKIDRKNSSAPTASRPRTR